MLFYHDALPVGDTADDRRPFAVSLEYRHGLRRILLGQGDDHADAHIEDIEHLAVRYPAVLLQKTEHGEYLPRTFRHLDSLPLLQDAGNILVENRRP